MAEKLLMDVYEVIKELRAEMARIDRFIRFLETVENPELAPRRGRKSMSAPERTAVSQRMKKYWAARRKRRPNSATS